MARNIGSLRSVVLVCLAIALLHLAVCGGQSRPGVRALGRLVFYASINSVAMTETLKKRLGRPATGKGTQVVVRLQPPMLALVDEWVKA